MMLNQIILIGRVVRDVEVKTATNGRPFAIVTMAVQRSFRNQHTQVYDTDFIDVSLWGATAENIAKYAGRGSSISVRGRVANRVLDYPGEHTIRSTGIIAEQVSFIQTKSPGQVVANDNNTAESADESDSEIIVGVALENMPSSDEFQEEFDVTEEQLINKESLAS